MTARTETSYSVALRRLRGAFVTVGLISAAINILILTGPVYMLQIYDRVLSSGSVATLQGLFVIVVVLYAFLGLYEFLRARLLSRAAHRLDELVGEDAFRCWIDRARGGREGGRDGHPVRDLEIVRGFMASPAIQGVFDLPWMPFFLLIVFLIHPWLGWLTVGGAAVVLALALLNQWLTRTSIAEAMALDGDERGFVERTQRAGETVHALGMAGRLSARWRALHQAALARGQSGAERSEGFSAFSKAFRLLLQSSLLTLGAWLVLQRQLSPGMIIAVSIIAGRALAPIDQVIGQWRSIGRAHEAHRRLQAAMAAMPAPATDAQRTVLPDPRGHIEVKNLTLLLPGDGPAASRGKALSGVNFALSPGDAVGVIGRSGSGKTTLARLLVGAQRPDAGEVRLDGATPDQYGPEQLGRAIGYLPQTLDLLPGTIAENISRFDPGASDEAVIAAARMARIHDMILNLSEGYATRIGGAVSPLSGGQAQRVGLARALYGNPKLIVLDEPNSNLDTEGDDALTEAVAAMRKRGSVVVVMAHRPSAIAAVNKVLVLHQGAQVQFGDKADFIRPAAAAPAAPATPPRPAPAAVAAVAAPAPAAAAPVATAAYDVKVTP
ncbi:MAG: type I secretion system permease/ATPase [Gemmobacter sp.]